MAPAPKEKQFTLEELRRHNSRSDLWISIQGKVYDVTSWVKDHPGISLSCMSQARMSPTRSSLAILARHGLALTNSSWAGSLIIKSLISPEIIVALAAEFSKQGLFEKRGHVALYTLTSIALLLFAAVLGVLKSESVLIHLLSGALIGVLWSQASFLGHDLGHHPFMKTPWLNNLAKIIIANCVTGISIGWWKWTHNAHHIACNSLDFDPDLQLMPVFAVSSKQFESLMSYFYDRKMNFDALARLLVSYQHWTFYPVMFGARINLFLQSMLAIVQKRVPNRKQELLGIALFWLWYSLLVSQLPNWGERVMFAFCSFAVSGIQHIQICMSHFSSNVYVGPPTANDWFEIQTMGTLNVTCSPWMDWFHGGLQFQVEHHLFPRLPRCNLRKISPLVRELCKKHKLKYSTLSFLDANVRTIQTLRAAALQARDVGNPAPLNLVWEAVNTHG